MKERVKTKTDKLKVTYKFSEDVSKEEAQRNLDRAYEILFNATLKNWRKRNSE